MRQAERQRLEETSTLIGEQRKGQVLGEDSGAMGSVVVAFVGGVYVEILRFAQDDNGWLGCWLTGRGG
jgi:hypothetical protein